MSLPLYAKYRGDKLVSLIPGGGCRMIRREHHAEQHIRHSNKASALSLVAGE